MSTVVSSQQVSWWSVHEFVSAVLEQVNGWPLVGTPAWCSLAHDDPQKWAALLDAAQHWALRLETCQEARTDASKAVAGAVDWPALGREISQRADFYAARPWLRRVSAYRLTSAEIDRSAQAARGQISSASVDAKLSNPSDAAVGEA